jgi:STE24 endopeptidase
MVLVNLFYTALILPFFNKLTPLADGELKDKILRYAQSVNFPLDNIFIMDGSRRSSKANAFFSGFGKRKKVVLFDTLLKQHTPDELVAVLAHEVGHYKKKHIILSMVLSVLQIGLLLFLLG